MAQLFQHLCRRHSLHYHGPSKQLKRLRDTCWSSICSYSLRSGCRPGLLIGRDASAKYRASDETRERFERRRFDDVPPPHDTLNLLSTFNANFLHTPIELVAQLVWLYKLWNVSTVRMLWFAQFSPRSTLPPHKCTIFQTQKVMMSWPRSRTSLTIAIYTGETPKLAKIHIRSPRPLPHSVDLNRGKTKPPSSQAISWCDGTKFT